MITQQWVNASSGRVLEIACVRIRGQVPADL